MPTDETLLLGGVTILLLTVSPFCLGGTILASAGGRRRPTGEPASDNTRTRAGGAGEPPLMGGLRAGGGGGALATNDGPALKGLGGGGGGGGLPGVVEAFLIEALVGCRLLREGMAGAGFVTFGVVARGGETSRCGTAGDGRNGIAGEGREGVVGGLELLRGGGARRAKEGVLVSGLGTVRAGRLGAGRLGGAGAGEAGFGGDTLTGGGVVEVGGSRFGIDGGLPRLGGFAKEKHFIRDKDLYVSRLTQIALPSWL